MERDINKFLPAEPLWDYVLPKSSYTAEEIIKLNKFQTQEFLMTPFCKDHVYWQSREPLTGINDGSCAKKIRSKVDRWSNVMRSLSPDYVILELEERHFSLFQLWCFYYIAKDVYTKLPKNGRNSINRSQERQAIQRKIESNSLNPPQLIKEVITYVQFKILGQRMGNTNETDQHGYRRATVEIA